jgi:hypothetical protein
MIWLCQGKNTELMKNYAIGKIRLQFYLGLLTKDIFRVESRNIDMTFHMIVCFLNDKATSLWETFDYDLFLGSVSSSTRNTNLGNKIVYPGTLSLSKGLFTMDVCRVECCFI